MALPLVAILQGYTCSVTGLFMDTCSEVLQHDLIHSYGYFKVYLLQHGHNHNTWRFTCFGMGISMVIDASGFHTPVWTHPQVTVPLTWLHTGVPACPVQQQWNSPGISQPCFITTAVIQMFPCTAEQNDKQYSSTASIVSKEQPLTSTKLYYIVRQAIPWQAQKLNN